MRQAAVRLCVGDLGPWDRDFVESSDVQSGDLVVVSPSGASEGHQGRGADFCPLWRTASYFMRRAKSYAPLSELPRTCD